MKNKGRAIVEKKGLSVVFDSAPSNLLIYVEGKGTMFNEPSFHCHRQSYKKSVVLGHEAARLRKNHEKFDLCVPYKAELSLTLS